MNETALHELLSGRRQDIGARLLRYGLHGASWAYSSVARLRNIAYDNHWLRIHRANAPVISLGNITTGGTGKTPMAAWLANWLTNQGHNPGLLSRGYRSLDKQSESPNSDLSGGNDEKLVLDQLCPGVPHLQQRDRVASAIRAVNEFGCNVLLLDDGFQHRRLHRDLDIVLIDVLQPWGYGHVLPRGLLREPLNGLRRADSIIMTRSDQCSPEQRQALWDQISKIRGTDERIEVAFTPSQLIDPNGQLHPLSVAAGKKAFAFCGIGNPEGFRKTLASLGVTCEQIQSFPDHHHYNEHDLSNLAQRASELSKDIVITTQKDLVKIAPKNWHGPPLYAVEIGVKFLCGGPSLESKLQQLLNGGP